MTTLMSQAPALLVAFPLVCVPALYFADHALRLPVRRTALVLYSTVALFTLYTVAVLPAGVQPVTVAVGGWPADLGIELALDAPARLFLPAIAGLCLLGVIGVAGRVETSTYYTLFFLLLAGSNGLALTRDLFNAYVFIEIASIAAYALVAARQDRQGFESAFKYLLAGSLASLLILWGIVGLYSATGSLSLPVIADRLADAPKRLAGGSGALIASGLLVKLGIVPFHAWKPDAMAGAPRAVAATLSGASVSAFFVLFARLHAGGIVGGQPVVFAGFAGASIALGHLMALRQTCFPRLLAYSSIAHFGYILAGLVAGTQAAVAAALLHALHHAVMKAGLFYYAAMRGAGAGESARDGDPAGARETARARDRDNAGAGHRQARKTGSARAQLKTAAFVVLAMGMIGIPPTAGFSSKWLLIFETARSRHIHPVLAGSLAVLIALGGAVALMYYLRFALLYGGRRQPESARENPETDGRRTSAGRGAIALSVCLVYTLAAFWFTDLLGELAGSAAATLKEL